MKRAGFTLVEVLAAMLLVGIVLPAVMKGITLSQAAGSDARRRTEAAGLAEGKLAELISTDAWQDGDSSGAFPDAPEYRWEFVAGPWADDTSGASIQQLQLRVIWTARSREDSVTLSTLAFAEDDR